ncbi:MAG TPA: presenilin family intramembrane aspartyl protease PSH [Methanoregulaceae archaeon]|nr:presenilin family intramembrane aspartyl protease PSH [Methanoregulaceae archaeon]
MERSRLLPLAGIVVMLVVAELGAALFGPLMQRAGIVAFEEPGSAANPFIFLLLLLGFTALLLLLIRLGMNRVIRAIVLLSIGLSFVYIFIALLGAVTAEPAVVLGGAVLLGAGAMAILRHHPEWYVIDLLGLLLTAGVAAIFGTSLGILPVLLLLVLLAVYDALSVYRTRHMIALAEGVLEQRAPILFVVPKERGYSFIRDGVGPVDAASTDAAGPARGEGTGRSALLIGMGDLIMPAILVVSANTFITAPGIGFLNGPALGAIAGSVGGLAVLLRFVDRGRAHAGLPPLNGGAILGFLAGCAATGAWAWF